MSIIEREIVQLGILSGERERLEHRFQPLMREELDLGNLVSYVGNKSVPLLRLYRYKEAFAFELVREFIRRFRLTARDYLFDPFAGMGTTTFASMLHGIPSIGIDRLPIAVFVARTIPQLLFVEPRKLMSTYEQLHQLVDAAQPAAIAMDVPIMQKAFSDKNLFRLRQWKTVIDALKQPLRDIFLLLFFAVLEQTSFTSKDGQFLRIKKNKRPSEPDDALLDKVLQAMTDINKFKNLLNHRSGHLDFSPTIMLGDTRELREMPFERPPTAIITSPPYANRYDYTRTYCLELCFHFAKNFEQLKDIRFAMLRSHIESKVSEDERPPHPAIQEVLQSLSLKDLNNPRIPHMLTGYFVDMQMVIQEWQRILAPAGQVAMVVDNVRFEGELVPVDLILSEMAEEAGFSVKEIIVCRYKGNSSQQMRKYGRVPVRESVVIWRRL